MTLARFSQGLAFLLGTILVLVFLLAPWSQVSAPEVMQAYLGPGVADGWAGQWQDAPERHRPLFHGVIDALVSLMLSAGAAPSVGLTWGLFVAVSAVTGGLAFAAVFAFVEAWSRSVEAGWMGVALFAALPSVHMAYVPPLAMREGFLAVAILLFALRAILQDRMWVVAFWAVLGCLTHQALLIIPLLYLVVVPGEFRRKMVVVGIPLAITWGLYQTQETAAAPTAMGDPMPVARAAVALAMVFGAAWIGVLVALAQVSLTGAVRRALSTVTPRLIHPQDANRRAATIDALLILLPLVLALHILSGRLAASHGALLLAPWVLIALAPAFAGAGVLRWIAATTLAGAVIAGLVWLEAVRRALVFRRDLNPELDQFAQAIWWLEAYGQLALLAAFLVLLIGRAHAPLAPNAGLRRY